MNVFHSLVTVLQGAFVAATDVVVGTVVVATVVVVVASVVVLVVVVGTVVVAVVETSRVFGKHVSPLASRHWALMMSAEINVVK